MFLRLAMLLSFGLGSLPGNLRAQDSTAGRLPARWDLQACIDYAKRNNITLNSLRLNVRTAEQNYLLAKAARQPNLTGSVTGTYTHSKNTNPVISGFQTQSSFNNDYSLVSGITIYNGDAINNNMKMANLQIQSSNQTVIENELDITLQIVQDYLNILLAKENVVYVEDLIKSTNAQVEQGKQEYEVGTIARNAYIELEAQLAADKYTLVTAQNAVRQNKLTLKQLLQLPIRDTFDIVTPDTVIATQAVPNLDSVEAYALLNRPEIKLGQLSIDISRYNLAIAKAGYLPLLTASAELSTGYSNNNHDAYVQQLDNNFFQSAGLNLSIPIFTRRQVKTNVENAKIQIEQSKLTLLGNQTLLSQTIEQAYINVLNAQGQYDAAVEALSANQEAFRVATEEQKVGATNLVAYLQQKTLYTQAFQNYVQAKYNAALSIEIYDFYMGIAVKL
ncbi:MAG TPA: TolC family protein [Puia sp.]|jgi:outer membrane protein|nr:TolC family protein [Puia sp.]